MTAEQIAALQRAHNVPEGQEWSDRAGLEVAPERLDAFLAQVPFRRRVERHDAAPVPVPEQLPQGRRSETASTQEAFGRIMGELARSDLPLAARIVTTSPDVTVSTSLGGWVGRREVFSRREHEDVFRAEQVLSPTPWRERTTGQHLELGIAENNLFLNLASLGLAHELFGARLLPVGTLYDPFIARGLDALNYACYQDARFLLVATPSGITLAPEGGAHQSIGSPLIGISQPGLTSFEPAYADEVAVMLRWAFEHLQAPDGGSVYLRLSTRQIRQPEREMTPELRAEVLAGGYWLLPPEPGAELAIVCTGVVAPEALKALAAVREDIPGAGLLHVTSADLLDMDWRRRGRAGNAAALLAPLAPDAALVTVLDGHPATLSWLGAVLGHRVKALGVDRFGQSADLVDLYRVHALDAGAILDACAAALLNALAAGAGSLGRSPLGECLEFVVVRQAGFPDLAAAGLVAGHDCGLPPSGSIAAGYVDYALCPGRVQRAAAASAWWAIAQSCCQGWPEAMAIVTRRTETRTRAPILSSRRRIVPAVAWASWVAGSAIRRRAASST